MDEKIKKCHIMYNIISDPIKKKIKNVVPPITAPRIPS